MTEQWESDESFQESLITGKALERYFESHAMLLQFSNLFDYEEKNERAVAIVGVSFLDLLLEHILREFFLDDEKEVEKLFKHDQGPLGTFSAKIKLSFCLGLIPKPIKDDLQLAAKIRNRFAHNLKTSFEEDEIRGWCKSLQWHRIAYASPPPDATARDLFQVGVNRLVTYLTGAVYIARSQRRKQAKY